MKHEEIEVVNSAFSYQGKHYNCGHLIERDMKTILNEADNSHRGIFDLIYDRNSLEPIKCRVYLNDQDEIMFIMLIYHVKYREGKGARSACGDYYPVFGDSSNLYPHPYQGSICW